MTFTSSLYEPAVAMKTFQLIYCVRENVLTLLAVVPSSFVFYFSLWRQVGWFGVHHHHSWELLSDEKGCLVE